MNIESLQPYLKYFGIGILGIGGIVLILWLGFAIKIMRSTKGLPDAINNFFLYMAENKISKSYQMTTANYRKKVNRKTFNKFIKVNKFRTYKKTVLGIPNHNTETNNQEISVTIVLESGKEIASTMKLIKKEKEWFVEDLIID